MIAAAQGCHKNRSRECGNASILYLGHTDQPRMSRHNKGDCHAVKYIKSTTFQNLFSNVGGIPVSKSSIQKH